jgi:galactokinase/mevalonate kinase-like predicted kinase
LIDQNWRQQQRLDATISTTATQQMEQVARQSGAWGVKAMGAGAGGCLVVLVPPAYRPALVEAVRAAGGKVLDMAFDFGGVTSWEDDASGDPG